MVADMPKYIQEFVPQILPPIWHLLTNTADIYVKVCVNEIEPSPYTTPLDDSSSSSEADFQTMILQCFEFINAIVESRKFRYQIDGVLVDLVYIMIVYMQMTQEQIETWSDDVEKFVEDEDENGSDFSIRVSGQDVLLSLGAEFEGKFLAALSEALTRHVNVAEAEKGAGNPNWWKIYEASMLAVGSFASLIIEKSDKFNVPQYLSLVRNLMDYQVSAFLLGRCLWVVSQFVQMELFSAQMLNEILDATFASFVQDKPLVLRMSAVRAIYNFCTNLKEASEDRRALVVTRLGSFIDGIVQIIMQCKSSVLGLVLETLAAVLSFDVNFTATGSGKVIPLTIAIFLKYHDDPFILELVQDLLKIFSQNAYCQQPLQEKIIPTITSILNMQGSQANTSMQEISLDVLQTIVKYSKPPLSPVLVENAFPAVVHCILRTDDHTLMQSGGECLRAYINVDPEQVCRYKNGEGLNYMIQVATMLLNPMSNEFTAVFIGRLVITIIVRAGNMLGENIDLLLKAIISKMQLVEALNVAMSLVTTFAHLILTQMEAVLNFLYTVPGPTGEPAMSFFFANWLTRQHLFYGAYERKVTIMAMCKLFEYGVTTQDPRLVGVSIREPVVTDTKTRTRSQTAASTQYVSVPILVKIFKLLLNELSNYREARLTAADDEWTDEDDDEGATAAVSPQQQQNGGDLNGGKVAAASVTVSGPSPRKTSPLKVSDLLFDDGEEDEDGEELAMLLGEHNLSAQSVEENLIAFLRTFSQNDHFGVFFEQLTDAEKESLQSIEVSLH